MLRLAARNDLSCLLLAHRVSVHRHRVRVEVLLDLQIFVDRSAEEGKDENEDKEEGKDEEDKEEGEDKDEEDTTVVEKIESTVKNEIIYNLQGIKVVKPEKGNLYIKDGKKFYVK